MSASWVSTTDLSPNPWNPNRMDGFMFEKAIASIKKFGFIDPIIVRPDVASGKYEIIDGEHRWKAAQQMGLAGVPIWDIGSVDDDTAKQLTIVLNETRGQVDEAKLSDLLKGLLTSTPSAELVFALPFSQERFDELVGKPAFSWDDLETKVDPQEKQTQWVERIYRLPLDAAEVLDRALAKAKAGETMSDAQALEMVAADFLGG